MGLKLNREKTRVVQMREEGACLGFLGYSFRFDRDLQGCPRRYLNVFSSKKAVVRERAKLREFTGPQRGFVPVAQLIGELNRHLRGWANYFGYGYPGQAFREINRYVRVRMNRHLRRRSQRRYRAPGGQSLYGHLAELGLVYL